MDKDRFANSNTEELEHMIKSGSSVELLAEISNASETAETYMKNKMKEKKIPAVDIVKACDSERSYVYQMLNGKRKPTRKFLLCFGLIVGLSVDEEQRLLKLAGRSMLYVKRRYDAVIYYALEHSMNMEETNALLYELGEETL